jgi:hypothetical protein
MSILFGNCILIVSLHFIGVLFCPILMDYSLAWCPLKMTGKVNIEKDQKKQK